MSGIKPIERYSMHADSRWNGGVSPVADCLGKWAKADDSVAREQALATRIAELEEAVRVLGELSRRQANRERLLEMDPDSKHPEVAEDQVKNGVALICAMHEVSLNPIAAAAVNPMYTPPTNTGEGVTR